MTCDTAATTLRTDGFVQPGTDGPFIYTILASHAALCHTPPHAPVAPPTEPPQAPPDGELLNYCLNNFSGLPIPGEISPCLHIKKTGCFDLVYPSQRFFDFLTNSLLDCRSENGRQSSVWSKRTPFPINFTLWKKPILYGRHVRPTGSFLIVDRF